METILFTVVEVGVKCVVACWALYGMFSLGGMV